MPYDAIVSTCAIQDQLSSHACWGCGPDNPYGLQIKSYWSGETTVCRYQPEPHQAGWPGVLNGGILATIIDCHCVCTAISAARPPENETPVAFATGSLSVSYLRPVPIDATVELTARIVERTPRKTRLECTVVAHGQVCARAEVLAIRLLRTLESEAGEAVA